MPQGQGFKEIPESGRCLVSRKEVFRNGLYPQLSPCRKNFPSISITLSIGRFAKNAKKKFHLCRVAHILKFDFVHIHVPNSKTFPSHWQYTPVMSPREYRAKGKPLLHSVRFGQDAGEASRSAHLFAARVYAVRQGATRFSHVRTLPPRLRHMGNFSMLY